MSKSISLVRAGLTLSLVSALLVSTSALAERRSGEIVGAISRSDGSTITVKSRKTNVDAKRLASQLNERLPRNLSEYSGTEIAKIMQDTSGLNSADLIIIIKCNFSFPPPSLRCTINITL